MGRGGMGGRDAGLTPYFPVRAPPTNGGPAEGGCYTGPAPPATGETRRGWRGKAEEEEEEVEEKIASRAELPSPSPPLTGIQEALLYLRLGKSPFS